MAESSPAAEMHKLAEDFVGLARKTGYELDYSDGSVTTVESFIRGELASRQPWRRGRVKKAHLSIAPLVGAYVGEIMVRKLGGKWVRAPEYEPYPAVKTPDGALVSPPAKAEKRFRFGKEDDLAFYFSFLRHTYFPEDEASPRV